MVSCITTLFSLLSSPSKLSTSFLFLLFLLLSISSSLSLPLDYCSALHKSLLFYETQRSGRLPEDKRIEWRGDSALNDSTFSSTSSGEGEEGEGGVYNSKRNEEDGNLAGGYYDAGDGMKFAFPLAFTTTTLSWGLIEFEEGIRECGEHAYYLETIKWATDWLIKAHTAPYEFYGQVGLPEIDHAFWGPPEQMTMERPSYKIDAENPGSDLAMEVAAALSAASIVFNSSDPEYSALLLKHAREMYTFGYEYQGFYHNSIPTAADYYRSYGFEDELVWGSAWLFLATQETAFLDRAKSDYIHYEIRYKALDQSFDWDQKSPGICVLMSLITGDPQYAVHADRWMQTWKTGSSIAYTPGGLAWMRRWGPLRYTASSSFLSLLINQGDWGQGQIDYMLGMNPQEISFVSGFGTKFPRNVLHRAAHGSTTNDTNSPVENLHVLNGALVGGPELDDSFEDLRTFLGNEVALDYNAGFTSAIAGLVQRKLTENLPTLTPPTSPPSPSDPPTLAPTPSPDDTLTLPTPVPTPVPTGPPQFETIEFGFHPSSSVWWLGVSFTDTSILFVEVMDSNAQFFYPLELWDWGYWTYISEGTALSSPLSFRLSFPAKTGIFTVNEISPGSFDSVTIRYF